MSPSSGPGGPLPRLEAPIQISAEEVLAGPTLTVTLQSRVSHSISAWSTDFSSSPLSGTGQASSSFHQAVKKCPDSLLAGHRSDPWQEHA